MHGFALQRRPDDLAMVRPHRALRHRRQGGHLDGRRRRRGDHGPGGRRGGAARRRGGGVRGVGVRPGSPSARTWPGGRPGSRDPAGADPAPRPGQSVTTIEIRQRKPDWLRAPARMGPAYLEASSAGGARPSALRDGVRRGRLPEPLRVLERGHRHVHGQRRAVHPRLRLLPRRHAAPRAAVARRAGARGRGGRRHGAALRGADRRGPRRPGRWRRGRVRGHHRGHPRALPGRGGRGPDLGLQGASPTRSRRSSPPVPTCSTTTSRPWPACSGRCGRRPATPGAWACWPGRAPPG